ncbi:hypothetical protein UFOVP1454_39 [uncultured Caudovirales phage]|uniref:SAP domain-containing protein n=1 Tax=uncultured Caudovirales phage TaxID=2100421 RepID=A0A6J5SIG5_9CAUD|nr:hypothetical protein UFOVP1454_39 [uncultured Caudovirales phage]
MQDFQNMPYFTLKQECVKAGLNGKGTKKELLSRLAGVVPVVVAQEPVQAEDVVLPVVAAPVVSPIIIPTQNDLERFMPNATHAAVIDVSKYAAWLTDERLGVLSEKIAPIAAGKGTFKYSINHKGSAYQIEFFGGASGDESTTLIDTDAQIVRRAQHYFNARMAKGGNGQSSRV